MGYGEERWHGAECLVCFRGVRLPLAPPHAWIRCPHCQAEYPLEQLLNTLPPLMEVIDVPDIRHIVAHGVVHTLDETFADGSDDKLRGGEPVAARRSIGRPIHFDNEMTSSGTTSQRRASGGDLTGGIMSDSIDSDNPQEPMTSVPNPPQLMIRRRVRTSHRKSMGWGMIKVVLGGMAGLVLGQIVLWWMPIGGRSDPFELVPRLPKALAFLAPRSLRMPSPVDDRTVETSLLPEGEQRDNPIDRGGIQEGNSSTPDTSSNPIQGNPIQGKQSLDGVSAVTQMDLSTSSSLTAHTREMLVGLADAPKYNIHELRESLRQAKGFLASYQERRMDNSEINRQINLDLQERWYQGMCEFAEHVTFADTSDREVSEFGRDAHQFLVDVSEQTDLQGVLSEYAKQRLRSANQHRTGVLVSGRVKQIAPAGRLFRTEIVLDDVGTTLQIISRSDPRLISPLVFHLDDRILVAGVLVTDPSLYLLGYEGESVPVVLGGMPIKCD